MNRALFALLASVIVGSALGESTEPAKIRITTWNLEWFPNGSPHETAPEKQAQRIQAAADVLKKLNPDILLLQEVRDYDACARLGEAIQPGAYTVGICSIASASSAACSSISAWRGVRPRGGKNSSAILPPSRQKLFGSLCVTP